MAEYARSYWYDKGLTIVRVPLSNLQLILPLQLSQKKTMLYNSLRNSMLTALSAIAFLHSQAQTVIEDSFSLQAGYEDMAFYSLETGVVAQSPLADWHLALDIRPMGSTARINCGMGMMLYPYGNLEQWLNVDFENWVTPEPLRNDHSDWSNAAFAQGGDGMFDLGWGVYDVITHEVESDKMYLIELPDGSWKQFALLSLIDGVYEFQMADIDGSNETLLAINKADYEGKLFAYCNLSTGQILDLEPEAAWDFQFLTYTEDIGEGTYYAVVGALAHPDVMVQQVDDLYDPYTDGDYNVDSFSLATNEVGYDWKSYIPGAGYALESSRCYFVSANDGNVWRMVMTGFDGASTGNISIGKVEATVSSVVDPQQSSAIQAFPNPIESGQNLTLQAPQRFEQAAFRICTASGAIAAQFRPTQFPWTVNTSNLVRGFYFVEGINAQGDRIQSRFVVD